MAPRAAWRSREAAAAALGSRVPRNTFALLPRMLALDNAIDTEAANHREAASLLRGLAPTFRDLREAVTSSARLPVFDLGAVRYDRSRLTPEKVRRARRALAALCAAYAEAREALDDYNAVAPSPRQAVTIEYPDGTEIVQQGAEAFLVWWLEGAAPAISKSPHNIALLEIATGLRPPPRDLDEFKARCDRWKKRLGRRRNKVGDARARKRNPSP